MIMVHHPPTLLELTLDSLLTECRPRAMVLLHRDTVCLHRVAILPCRDIPKELHLSIHQLVHQALHQLATPSSHPTSSHCSVEERSILATSKKYSLKLTK